MRIVHFRQAFSILTETFIYDSILEMRRQGVDCRVITLRRTNEDDRPFDPVVVLPLPPKAHPARLALKLGARFGGRSRDSYAWPLFRRSLEPVLRRLRPDAIHAHFGPDAVLVAPIARDLNIPLAVTFYGYDCSVKSVVENLKNDYKDLFNQCNLIIGVSGYVCDRLIAMGADSSKVALVRLGVRSDRFSFSDPVLRFDGKAVRCLHVGRLTPKKSPLELVDAFGLAVKLVRSDLDLSLSIVGDGPLAAELKRKITDMGLENRIHLLGALSHERVVKELNKSHIYTQHSVIGPDGDEEGQPVSIVEAAAMGLPIVSTFHSGIPEVVLDGRTGYLVKEHDAVGMGMRIADLACDPALWSRLGAAGRRHVEANFSLEHETSKMIKFYGDATRLSRCTSSVNTTGTGYCYPTTRRLEETSDIRAAIEASVMNYFHDQLGWSIEDCRGRVVLEQERSIPKKILDELEDRQWLFNGVSVLDVGAGQGGCLLELLDRGADAVGIEPGAEFAALARLRLGEAGHDPARLRNVAGETLPFPDCSFDYVISLQVLEHVRDPAAIVSEMLRVLKPGGRCYLACENYLSFREQHYRVRWLPLLPKSIGAAYLRLLGRNPDFLKRFVFYTTLPQISRICRQIGFRNISVEEVGFNTPNRRLVDSPLGAVGEALPASIRRLFDHAVFYSRNIFCSAIRFHLEKPRTL